MRLICNKPNIFQITIKSVPAPINAHPIKDFIEKLSCRNTNAIISVITTLSLSTGTTFDAFPNCNAL